MSNRVAVITLYTVPEGATGRKEAEVVERRSNGTPIKQNLILHLQSRGEDGRFRKIPLVGKEVESLVFTDDDMNVHDRIKDMVRRFGGESNNHVRAPDYEAGSFHIRDQGALLDYLEAL